MTSLQYPRARVDASIRPLTIGSAYRIFGLAHIGAPLSPHLSVSRFCDGRSGYSVLYAALTFDTAFAETILRDRFVQRAQRTVSLDEILARAWVRCSTQQAAVLTLIDLGGSGCLDLGVPTDAVRSRHQAAGQALSRAIYREHEDVDGFMYPSRLTGGDCLAIFDRAVAKLVALETGRLEDHPELPDVLMRHRTNLQV
jgi:RES domain